MLIHHVCRSFNGKYTSEVVLYKDITELIMSKLIAFVSTEIY